MTTIKLPWPPTANTYYRRVGNRTLISRRGREYKREVYSEWLAVTEGLVKPLTGSVWVEIEAFPPDARRRDLDNLLKPILDSLNGLAWVDDSQIDAIEISRGQRCRGGEVFVTIHRTEEL